MVDHVDVDGVAAPCFVLTDDLPGGVDSGWHQHRRGQLLYARRGVLDVETERARWQLPPQRAAWIPPATEHRVRARRPAQLATVYFDCATIRTISAELRTFPIPPLGRELILHAAAWGIEVRTPPTVSARVYFSLLADLCASWVGDGRPWFLPTARSPELRRACDHIIAHLHEPLTAADVAKASALSTRSLARRFREETATTFARFLRSARILAAIDHLSEGTMSVTQVSLAVGFLSTAAFSRAFTELVGQGPRSFRHRDADRRRDERGSTASA